MCIFAQRLETDLQTHHETVLDVSEMWFSPNTAQNPTSTYTTFSASADVAIVEVDTSTGEVRILRYFHVHDAGKIINEQIVDGQVYGGVVQGMGEALTEELLYDIRGNLLSCSYGDYIMPTALDAPDIEVDHIETPSPFTELGTKGMGEAPTIGSKVAFINAIEDALSDFGIVVDDTSATKERIWKLIAHSKERHE